MAYTLASANANNVGVAGISVPPGGVSVDYLTPDVLLAKANGLITINPDPATNEPAGGTLTVAAGTPSTTTTTDVGGSFVQATLNNQIATLATLLNKAVLSVNALQTQVRAHEARLDSITRGV